MFVLPIVKEIVLGRQRGKASHQEIPESPGARKNLIASVSGGH
jgi:hypothetical protein